MTRQSRVHINTINAFWRRYQQTDPVWDRPRSEHPRGASRRQDTYTWMSYLRNRFPIGFFDRLETLLGIDGCPLIALFCSGVTVFRGDRRLGGRDWVEFLFTDESRYHLDSSDSRVRVIICRAGEPCTNTCVIQHRQFDRGSVIVWDGITTHGRNLFVIVEGSLISVRYCDCTSGRHSKHSQQPA